MNMAGRKRINEDDDAGPKKRAKVKRAAAAAYMDVWLEKKSMDGEMTADGTKEEEGVEAGGGEEEEVNPKLDRLCSLLADDPKMLNKKDKEEIINNLNVDKIIRLALKANQVKRGYDDAFKGKWTELENVGGKALETVRSMLTCIEFAKTTAIRELYERWPSKAFTVVLLSALDYYAERNPTNTLKMEEYYDIIPRLCSVLPWELFAYVLCQKGVLFLQNEEEEEEMESLSTTDAEMCDYCGGIDFHTGVYVDGDWIDCSNKDNLSKFSTGFLVVK